MPIDTNTPLPPGSPEGAVVSVALTGVSLVSAVISTVHEIAVWVGLLSGIFSILVSMIVLWRMITHTDRK